ncbi:sodium:solute symporter [Virgibacillus byunsanensis]|uniref:Sodium:solute symporter n=1 Tax=Virgibacillus byunsanensis TaxID=570945 RepID=A0ABW3LKP1_9BACI
MSSDNIVILGTLFVYMIFMLWVGFRVSKKLAGIDDYILAGRNLPWFVLTMTFLATLANTAQVMGQPGFSYATGLSYVFWMNVASLTIGTLLLPRIGLRLRGLNISTIGDFVVERFAGSKRLELLVSGWQVLWGLFVTAMSLFGAALLVEVVTGVSWKLAIVIIAVVTIIYTVTGGLRAVVVTDSVQWLIIIFGTALFVPLIFLEVGPFSSFFSQYLGPSGFELMAEGKELSLFAGFTDIFTLAPGQTYLPSLLAFIVATSLWIPIDLGFIQRMLAARNIDEGRKGTYVFLGMQILVISLLIMLGMYGRVLIPGLENTDKIIVVLAQETLPVFGAALFIAAVAAAAMSTISTYLNAGSTVILKNFVMSFKPDITPKSQLLFAKIFTVLICLSALSFAPFISAGGIVAAAVAIQIILVTALSPVIILGVFWKRLTEKGAFWGCLVTSIVTFILMMAVGGPNVAVSSPGFFGIPVVFWGGMVASIFFVGFSLLEPYNPKNMSSDFQKIFSGEKAIKKSKTDIKILSCLWAVLIIIGVFMNTVGESAFPPLAGPLAFLTDAYFLITSIVVLIVSVFMIIKLVGYIRNEVSFNDIEKRDKETKKIG